MAALIRRRGPPAPKLLIALLPAMAEAFYLPGVSPREYAQGERVDLKVNKLTSTKTQLPYGKIAATFVGDTR